MKIHFGISNDEGFESLEKIANDPNFFKTFERSGIAEFFEDLITTYRKIVKINPGAAAILLLGDGISALLNIKEEGLESHLPMLYSLIEETTKKPDMCRCIAYYESTDTENFKSFIISSQDDDSIYEKAIGVNFFLDAASILRLNPALVEPILEKAREIYRRKGYCGRSFLENIADFLRADPHFPHLIYNFDPNDKKLEEWLSIGIELEDRYYYFTKSVFHHLNLALKTGTDLKKFKEVYKQLEGLDLLDKLDQLRDLINLEYSVQDKKRFINIYDDLKDVPGLPNPVCDDSWIVRAHHRANEYVLETYSVGVDLPLDLIIKFAKFVPDDEEKRIIGYILDPKNLEPITKNFPAAKIYERRAVINGNHGGVYLTRTLLNGLIFKNEEKKREAGYIFGEDKLKRVTSAINKKEAYELIKDKLQGLKEGDDESARTILSRLEEKYKKAKDLHNLVGNVKSILDKDEAFDSLEIRTKRISPYDIFDGNRLICCAFYPSEKIEKRKASLFYLIDSDISLLHLAPSFQGKDFDSIGVAVLVNCLGSKGNKYLLVDSVEGGLQLEGFDDIWKKMFYNSIMALAREKEAGYVAFNLDVPNETPKKFNKYVKRKDEVKTLYLEKVGGVEAIKPFGREKHLLESWMKYHKSDWNIAKGDVTAIVVPTNP